ncbi:lysine--tRNA ligase [Paenibacillus allorhizosphaerae]|uniref:Lysine--tRNA ligase n=1 Tax=Paenibacillus allorhizosphaerae TaxID=2849866 RepID=A0ABN7TDV8_9BACL|nr:lysine--tRNA ligase [Paenibacillus allorhizosphaerae]CAG7626400.1 Lysine--tRNA ligase [Paenibacillus allorhizosphaerae]
MHWAYSIANRLIEQHPDRSTFVCASGISPSGAVHIGNFREIVTTYFVVRALEQSDQNLRFIFSWDDFDRFRKVPAGIDPAFEKYIGMPYSEVPCPYGCHDSYAQHFERQFENALSVFGIQPEFIYQSREYQSKRYNPSILHVLRKRKEIYDIVMAFKTGDASEDERDGYFPVHVYCEVCRKDTTTIQSFDEQTDTLAYSCQCGRQDMLYIPDATNIKLQWKLDWPMRWSREGVLFEPGGRDHSSETGSYNVAKALSEIIFENVPPAYLPYEFISIKGSHTKMSSSSGHNYTPDDLLNVYSPELILFMFAKYQPSAAFHIGMDEDVIRNYTEYERYREGYDSGTLNSELKEALELSMMTTEPWGKTPKFSHVSSLLPLVHFDRALLKDILTRNGEEYSIEELEPIVRRAEHWIKCWYPQKQVEVKECADTAFYNTLSSTERGWVQAFCGLLKSSEVEGEQLMEQIYAICHDEDKKVMRSNQKRLFTIIYNLVLNQNEGPRIPWLIQAVGPKKLLDLMEVSP